MSATAPTVETPALHRLILLLQEDERVGDGVCFSEGTMAIATEALGVPMACVYRRLRDGTLELAGSSIGSTERDLAAAMMELAASTRGLVARSAASESPAESAIDAAVEPAERMLLERIGAATLHAVPLRARGDLVGVLLYATPGSVEPGIRARESTVGVVAAAFALALAATGRTVTSPHFQLVTTMHEVVDRLLEQVAWEPFRRVPHFGGVPPFDEEAFLATLLNGAVVATNAQLAALGVGYDPEQPFSPFITAGASPGTAEAIRRHPRPVATLGAVAVEGETIRVHEAADHPAFVGVPQHHPAIHSLLAIPIRIRGRSFGNLYLANKRNQLDFTKDDQEVVELLAALAAMGLHFARFAKNEVEHETMRQILEATPDGVLYVDKLTGNMLISRTFERIYGCRFQPVGGPEQQLGMLCWPDGRPLTRDELPSIRALRGEVIENLELLVVRPDGTHVPISERAVPFKKEGAIQGSLVCARDLSPVKEVERVREEFAAMVVHDLRNPIQSILLQIRALRAASEAGKPLASSSWDRLTRNASRLARMATDMLDSTRIELSRISLDRAPTDPVLAVRNIVETLRTVFPDHVIVLESPDLLPPVMLDIVRFDQILTNLVENAAKHSAEGTTIHVELHGAPGGIELSVRDEGVGISPEELPRLFDRFYQARRAREQRSGLGLGLPIAKGLAEAHGGHIGAESIVDRGSTFRVWLPTMTMVPATTTTH
jgi:PAS domain S-box-containing protein